MRFLSRSLEATARSPLAAFARLSRGRPRAAAELGAGRALTSEARRPAPPVDDNDRGTAPRAARPQGEV
jgi:hypothetical protein